MTRDKLKLQVKAALVIARQTKKPLDLVTEDLMHWIDEYHAAA